MVLEIIAIDFFVCVLQKHYAFMYLCMYVCVCAHVCMREREGQLSVVIWGIATLAFVRLAPLLCPHWMDLYHCL